MIKLDTVEEIDAAIETLQKERDEKLKAERGADLETVKQLLKKHKFTQTELRGYIKARKKSKA